MTWLYRIPKSWYQNLLFFVPSQQKAAKEHLGKLKHATPKNYLNLKRNNHPLHFLDHKMCLFTGDIGNLPQPPNKLRQNVRICPPLVSSEPLNDTKPVAVDTAKIMALGFRSISLICGRENPSGHLMSPVIVTFLLQIWWHFFSYKAKPKRFRIQKFLS